MQPISITLGGETTKVQPLDAAKVSPWAFPTVAAIGPKGQIVVRHFDPNVVRGDTAIGDVPIKTISGMPVLDPMYAARGWVMYEDLCAGRVPGVEADPDAWKRWQSLVQYNAAGRPLPKQLRDDDKLFHPEVARRRKAGGIEVMPTVDEFRAQFPGLEFDDEPEDTEPAPKRSRKGKDN